MQKPSGPILANDGDELAQLMRQAAAGDALATRQFLDRMWPVVARVVSGVLGGSHPDIEDAVQQVLIGLTQALTAFRGECHPVGYVSRIALRVALKVRRSARRRGTPAELTDDALPASSVVMPADPVGAERRNRVLRELLADLPEEQAEALGLRAVLGWSLEEVSVATGAPINTIRSRVRLAKLALRRRIEANPRIADALEVTI